MRAAGRAALQAALCGLPGHRGLGGQLLHALPSAAEGRCGSRKGCARDLPRARGAQAHDQGGVSCVARQVPRNFCKRVWQTRALPALLYCPALEAPKLTTSRGVSCVGERAPPVFRRAHLADQGDANCAICSVPGASDVANLGCASCVELRRFSCGWTCPRVWGTLQLVLCTGLHESDLVEVCTELLAR